MSVTEPNLSIEVVVQGGCAGLTLIDNTGVYTVPTNIGGYGLPDGPSVNDVVTVTVNVNYRAFGSTVQYVFTVASGVITAATISLGGATPVDIFAYLSDTTWPFDEDHPFNLTGEYGVTLPTFGDDIYSVTYTIAGTTPDVFTFSAIVNTVSLCTLELCAENKWAAVDPNCGCSDESYAQANKLQSLIYMVSSAVGLGKLSAALQSLEQAQIICANEDCGCS